jgi:hypothetical protein
VVRLLQRRPFMSIQQKIVRALVSAAVLAAAVAIGRAQSGAETFTATASVKTAGAASASAPVTITVDRKMTQAEADGFLAAFKSGGVAGLRKALEGVPPTGSVQFGKGTPTPTRLTLERTTDQGRLLTIVSDKPIALLGAGLPDAKPKEGFDFGVIDLIVDAKGSGTGTIAPGAKVTVKQGVFVVQDYSSEVLRLTGVTKVK